MPARLRITTTVTSKSQLVIPKYLREKLRITPGTRLQVRPVAGEGFVATPIDGPKGRKP